MESNQEELLGPENCSHFYSCSQNFCPLDDEFNLRSGSDGCKCRYSREPKMSKVCGREFVSGGAVMPDASLNLVSRENLKHLNRSSQTRWEEINN